MTVIFLSNNFCNRKPLWSLALTRQLKHNTPRAKMGMPIILQLCGKSLLVRRKSPLWKTHLIKQCFKLYSSDPEVIIYNKYLWTIRTVTTHRCWTVYLWFNIAAHHTIQTIKTFTTLCWFLGQKSCTPHSKEPACYKKQLKVLGNSLFLVFYVHILIYIFLLSLWYTTSFRLFTYCYPLYIW